LKLFDRESTPCASDSLHDPLAVVLCDNTPVVGDRRACLVATNKKPGEIHGENWVSIQHLMGYPQPQNLEQI